MQAAASATALSQLALLRTELAVAILETGWQLEHLQLELRLHRTADTVPLRQPEAAAVSGAAAPEKAGISGALEAAAAGLGAPEPHKALLPLLEVRVRGSTALVATVELTTGELCLSAGSSGIRGRAVVTVCPLL